MDAPLVGETAATSLQEAGDMLTTVELQQELDEQWPKATGAVLSGHRRHLIKQNDELERIAGEFLENLRNRGIH